MHKESSPLPSEPRLDRRVLQTITAGLRTFCDLPCLSAASDVFIGICGQQYGWIAPNQEVSGLEDEYLNAGGTPKLVDTIGTMGQLGLLPPLG